MKTVTIRDFRTRPKEVREALRREREAVLTVNGRPVALMIPVDAESLDEKLETLRRARGLDALREIRRESAARGLTRLSIRGIDTLVRATRKVKRRAGRG